MLQTVVGMGALWVGVDTYRNTLKEANIEADPVKNKTTQCQNSVEVVVVVRGVAVERHSLVPLDARANCQKQTRSLDVCSGTELRTGTMLRAGARTDLHKRQGDLGVPLLGRLRTGTTGTRIVSVCV